MINLSDMYGINAKKYQKGACKPPRKLIGGKP